MLILNNPYFLECMAFTWKIILCSKTSFILVSLLLFWLGRSKEETQFCSTRKFSQGKAQKRTATASGSLLLLFGVFHEETGYRSILGLSTTVFTVILCICHHLQCFSMTYLCYLVKRGDICSYLLTMGAVHL